MFDTISRILFTTDMNRRSTVALKNIIGLASTLKAELTIFHVVEPLSNDAKVTLMMFMQNEQARNEAMLDRVKTARSDLDERLDKFWASVSDEDRKMQSVVTAVQVKEGYASDVILKQAKNGKFDLIVMGGHKRGPASIYVGTVAKRVQRRAEVMTLLIPYAEDK